MCAAYGIAPFYNIYVHALWSSLLFQMHITFATCHFKKRIAAYIRKSPYICTSSFRITITVPNLSNSLTSTTWNICPECHICIQVQVYRTYTYYIQHVAPPRSISIFARSLRTRLYHKKASLLRLSSPLHEAVRGGHAPSTSV